MERPLGYYKFRAAVVLLLTAFTGVGGLRDVEIRAPLAVAPGSTATLVCHYDLEGDPLYTVKWYKGREEFFRYVPKELPHTRVFALPGVNVDVSASGPDRVVLRDVQKELAGKYRCEVSADAPNFHTQVVSTHMHVVHKLEGDPRLYLEKGRYSVGDTLRGNCSAPPSNPPANITWTVNGKKVNSNYITRTVWPHRLGEEKRILTTAGIEIEVDGSNFQGGKMRVACVADIYSIYSTQTEVVVDEERPRLASVLGTRDSSSGGNSVRVMEYKLRLPLVGLLIAVVFSR